MILLWLTVLFLLSGSGVQSQQGKHQHQRDNKHQIVHNFQPYNFTIPKKETTPPKKLRFIHITKSGGSSIEEAAILHNIHWGVNDLDFGQYSPLFIKAPWHYPFSFFPHRFPRHNFDWFLVHRNPYDRILSEFHCQWGGVGEDVHKYTVATFNKFVVDKIKLMLQIVNFEKKSLRFNGMHYIPQYLYYDANVTMHLLPFKNLTVAFNDLMQKYDLPVRLNTSYHLNNHTRVFTRHDLSPETKQLIQHVYRKDFAIFGYDM